MNAKELKINVMIEKFLEEHQSNLNVCSINKVRKFLIEIQKELGD